MHQSKQVAHCPLERLNQSIVSFFHSSYLFFPFTLIFFNQCCFSLGLSLILAVQHKSFILSWNFKRQTFQVYYFLAFAKCPKAQWIRCDALRKSHCAIHQVSVQIMYLSRHKRTTMCYVVVVVCRTSQYCAILAPQNVLVIICVGTKLISLVVNAYRDFKNFKTSSN